MIIKPCIISTRIVLTLLLAFTTTFSLAATRDPVEFFFSQSFGDLREEAATAKKEGKVGLLIMFDNAECPWCRKMKATVLNQDFVQDYYRKYFRAIEVDTEGSNPIINFDGKEMMEKDYTLKVHRVRATPVFLFLDLEGKKTTRYTGAVSSVEEFMWLGEFVAKGHYKTTNFSKFKRQRQAAGK